MLRIAKRKDLRLFFFSVTRVPLVTGHESSSRMLPGLPPIRPKSLSRPPYYGPVR